MVDAIRDDPASFTELAIAQSLTSVLGLEWDPTSKELPTPNNCQVLSEVARIFNSVGFVTPIIVRSKIIIPKVAGLNWDKALPDTTAQIWQPIRNGLDKVKRSRIP